MMIERLRKYFDDLRIMWGMPHVVIDLAARDAVNNDLFYAKLVDDFFKYVWRRHPRFPLIHAFEYGVALCLLPRTGEGYEGLIEASGRRNIKKARRMGYEFKLINFNDYLDDIRDIRKSTDVRQGEVTGYLRDDVVEPCRNPPSRTTVHDYVYYGVLKEGRLVAYAGCIVAGELCMIEHILGHASMLGDGIVPLLIAELAADVASRHIRVRYFAYGTFFGGGETMRRFKKKFGFLPHRVTWRLG